MELLNPILIDLEKAEVVLGSLETYYIRQVYPQFREDFTELGIADIDNYANYNLKNILDDLKHLQDLLDGSPSKRQFDKKIEFLVQLTEGTLKRVLKVPTENKKVLRETAEGTNKENITQKNKDNNLNLTVAEPQIEVISATKLVSIRSKEITTSKETSPKKTNETSPKKTKENNIVTQPKEDKKEVKKKIVIKEEKLLAKISEKKASEEGSELGSPIAPNFSKIRGKFFTETSEFEWRLTEEQETMVSSTLKKYDMSENIWKNYILTRVHGDAQLRRMGIETGGSKKVDYAIETVKFVEELERHMSRKARSLRKSQAINLKPIQSNPAKPLSTIEELDSLALSLKNIGPKSTIHKANTLPSLDIANSNHDQLLDNEKPGRKLKKLQTAPEARISEINTELEKNNLSAFKIQPLSTSHITSYNILNKFSPVHTLDRSFNPNQIPGSLHGTIFGEEADQLMAKSQGKFKLPSVSSSKAYIDNKPSNADNLNSIISPKNFNGRRYKKASEEESQQVKTALINGRFSDSIDSLHASTIANKERKLHNLVNNLGSNEGTIDSKYLKSLEEIPEPSSCEIKNVTGKDAKSNKEDYIRTDKGNNESLISESQSLNSSARTLLTVYSNDSRMAISRNFMIQSNRFGGMVDREYVGDIRRLSLLGSGSEAKVFLCRAKGIEGEVALKQYDLVENQGKNSQAYNGLKGEFEMLKNLEHENIIRYLCLYKPIKTKYNNCIEFGIIMEHMKGGSLESLIEEGTEKVTYKGKKRIIKQILEGIVFLHQHNIIHRDLKPGNILLSEDKSRVKISDFGISKKTDNDTHTKRTLVGTPWYMAPEVISQEGYSSKADIWSLGCCIFHLITGQKPYTNANAIQALLLMVNSQSPLESCSPDVTTRLDALPDMRDFLSRCFCRNQNERPSAELLLQHSIFDEII